MVTRKFGGRRRLLAATAAACAAVSAVAIFVAPALAAPPPAWSGLAQADGPGSTLTAVTCPANTLCVGIDAQGHSVQSATPALNTGWAVNSGAGLTNPSSISCPQGALCVATEGPAKSGDIAETGNSAGAWTTTTVDSGNTLTGVSCPSTGLCVAVDNAGNVMSSTSPTNPTPAAWPMQKAIDGTTTLNAISCPTTGFCAAVDTAGNVLTSTSPQSGPWQKTRIAADSLNGISCTSSTACVALDATTNGDVYATANASTPPVTWSTTPVDPGHVPTAVSCTDAGLCVFVDDSGIAFSSDTIASARPGWSAATVDPGSGLTGVSCNAVGYCVAVDSTGHSLVALIPLPAPTTGTGSASDQMDATVAGSVDPGDAVLTNCHFDYGTTSGYGATVPCASTPTTGGGAQGVSSQISGLTAGTTYHFRVAAATAVASAVGADATFTTPPPLKANPSLSGTPGVGSTLTCKPNVTTTAAEVVTYQWLSDTGPIASANAATYVIQTTDATHHLSCQVTISGDGGSASATSGFDAVPAQAGPKLTESFAGTATDSSRTVKVPVTCSPQAATQCTFTLTLTTTETVNHTAKTVPLGSSKAILGPGATRTLSVSLSAAGRTLLSQKHTLQVTFAVSGTLLGTLTATLQTDKFKFNAPKPPKQKKKATQQSKKKKKVKKASGNAATSGTR